MDFKSPGSNPTEETVHGKMENTARLLQLAFSVWTVAQLPVYQVKPTAPGSFASSGAVAIKASFPPFL